MVNSDKYCRIDMAYIRFSTGGGAKCLLGAPKPKRGSKVKITEGPRKAPPWSPAGSVDTPLLSAPVKYVYFFISEIDTN